MVAAAKRVLGPGKSVSVKIRLHADADETERFLRTVVEIGDPDFVTVHARTRKQRSSTAPDLAALAELKRRFPHLLMLANGDVFSAQDAADIAQKTGVEGVMAARGLLENPALFAGFERTPVEAVDRFMRYAVKSGLKFELIVHHVVEMMGQMANKRERKGIVACRDTVELTDWLDARLKLRALAQ